MGRSVALVLSSEGLMQLGRMLVMTIVLGVDIAVEVMADCTSDDAFLAVSLLDQVLGIPMVVSFTILVTEGCAIRRMPFYSGEIVDS